LTGIQLAYHIQKHCENVEHVIYEKNPDVGGTWYENRYPGKNLSVQLVALYD
jgi:cation diffusion facilitator CzcD-associated flavoprotein CzcO